MAEYQDRRRVSPATAALSGLLVGVAAGIVATALTNRQTRKKVLRRVDEMGQAMEDTYERTINEINDTWEDEIQPRLRTASDAVRRGRRDATTRARQQVDELAVKGGEVADDLEDQVTSTRSRFVYVQVEDSQGFKVENGVTLAANSGQIEITPLTATNSSVLLVDPSQAPHHSSQGWIRWWPYITLIVIALAGLGFAWWYRKKKQPKNPLPQAS